MKKSLVFTLMVSIPLIFTGLSCKSEPKPTEPLLPVDQSAVKPENPAPDALNKALARANAARQRAADFEGDSYFPSEWEAAEAQYTAAGVNKSAAEYNAAADAYDGIFNRTIPLYAQAREDEIMAVRNEITATGLRRQFGDYLSPADQRALQAMDQAEAEDYYTARDSAANALSMYQALNTAAQAVLLREEIQKRQFTGYDSGNFNNAGEALVKAMDAYHSGDIPAAARDANEALLRYKLVLNSGWAAYAVGRRSAAEACRQAAIDVKANVAVKKTFNEGETNFTQADNRVKNEEYHEAADLFAASEQYFISAKETAEEKRRIAAAAIKEAEEKIAESDKTAWQAELQIEGVAQ